MYSTRVVRSCECCDTVRTVPSYLGFKCLRVFDIAVLGRIFAPKSG